MEAGMPKLVAIPIFEWQFFCRLALLTKREIRDPKKASGEARYMHICISQSPTSRSASTAANGTIEQIGPLGVICSILSRSIYV